MYSQNHSQNQQQHTTQHKLHNVKQNKYAFITNV